VTASFDGELIALTLRLISLATERCSSAAAHAW
jgi:hypothetical protein